MKLKATFVLFSCLVSSAVVFGQDRTTPAVDTVAPNIPGVIAGGTKVHVMKQDFKTGVLDSPIGLTDGTWLTTERDSGLVWKVDRDGEFTVLLDKLQNPLGIGMDMKGRLIAVQTAPPQKTAIAMIYPKGQEKVLADTFEGQPLGRPNDLVVNKKGGVYFTAPATSAGQVKAGYFKVDARVYYIAPEGKLLKIADSFRSPNGIQLSPDEKVLYVNDSAGEYIVAFDVQPDGTVTNRRDWGKYDGTTKGPDGTVKYADAGGMAVDAEGRVYAVTQLGVQVFSNQGQYLNTIPMPRPVENVGFVGPDKKTLVAVGGGIAVSARMLTEGYKGRPK